jgi:hypothetical protein
MAASPVLKCGMGWKIFQTTIVLAVVFSEIRYGWAHGTSGLAVCVVAIFAAWMATAVVFAVRDLSKKLRALLLRRNQSIDDSRLARREIGTRGGLVAEIGATDIRRDRPSNSPRRNRA